MCEHQWPGNVRELENAVERAVILAESGKAIGPELLGLGGVPISFSSPSGKLSVSKDSANIAPDQATEEDGGILTMDELEKNHILRALESTNGNRTKTSELLDINVRTLRNKIRQYKIEGEAVL